MALTMEKKIVEAEQVIGSAYGQIPLRAESEPTGLREAAEILWEDARLYLAPARAADSGAEVEGTIYCQALYRLSGDSALRTAVCEMPIREMLEIEGAQSGMTAVCEGDIEHLEARYSGGRVVFTGAAGLRARISAPAETEIVASASGDGLECRTQTCVSRKLTAENAAMATLRDEVSLPAALRARGVLITRSTVKNIRCEPEPGGVRVGGEILTEALIRCGVEERPVAMVKYTLPFEQALSFPDSAAGEAVGAVAVRTLDCRLDDEDSEDAALKILCEVRISAGLYAVEETAVISDAYGTGSADYTPQTIPLRLCAGTRTLEGREDFRGELLLPEGAQGVGAVLAVRAVPRVSETEGDIVRGVVESMCLYVPAGREQVSCVRGETPFEMKFSDAIPANSNVRMEALDADALSVVSDRMEIRCTLWGRCISTQEETLQAVSHLIETPAAKPPAALVIHYAAGKEELWDIARRYRVRLAEVKKLNPQMQRPQPGEPILVFV